jgi:hypothetical protein
MDPSVLLKQRGVQWSDPLDDYSKLQTLRQMMDQRRIREQQYQMHQLAMQKSQQEMADAQQLREALSGGIPVDANLSDMVKRFGPKGVDLYSALRQAQSAEATRKTAELTQQKTALDLQGERAKREANTYAAVTALPQDQQQDWWDTNVGGGLPVDRPPSALEEQAKYAEAYGGEALQKRRDAQEKAIRDNALYAIDVPKHIAEAKTAQDKAEGKEPATGSLREFETAFYPGWLADRNLPPSATNQYKAYLDWQEGRRPRIAVPGVDVPYSPAVAQQKIDMAKEGREAKPPTEGERKTLGFYERMKNAEEALGTVEDTLSKLSTVGQIRLKSAPDWAQTKEGQLYHQALRQFTEARLRKESGAVIGPSEFEYSEKTFFPQPNEDPATRKRKKEARDLLLNSMRREAGKAYTQTYGEAEPATTSSAAATKGSGSEKPVIRWGKDANGNPVRLN